VDWFRDPNILTAVSTVVIAVFTVVLAVVGFFQARLIRKSIDLARDEFNSSHRPRIIMRDVWCEPGGDIYYMLFNTGDAPTTIVESWIQAEFVPTGTPLRQLRSAGHDHLGKLKFAAGEMKDLTYQVPAEIGAYMLIPSVMNIANDDRPAMHGGFYFTGAILYEDGAGNRRRSVFRRWWDRDGKCFVRLEDQRDHEYAD
jgi:hypothetical protein